MKKPELKTGMVVETRDGGLFFVLIGSVCGDVLLGIKDDRVYINLNEHGDDLTHKIRSDLDVVKIYTTRWNCGLLDIIRDSSFSTSAYEFVWEKEEEQKEYTVEQLEKVLGHKIKIVGT